MSDVAPIATMPLYTNVDRIAKGLVALGIGPTDPIRPEQLFAMDQWHYHGTDAIRDTAKRLNLGPKDRVLDVGSGVGGPARWLAHTIGCHVTALELQPELNALSKRGDVAAMTALVDDSLLERIAVRGTPAACARELRARFGDVADRVCVYFPGTAVRPQALAELVSALA